MKIKYNDILNADEPLSLISKEKVTIKEAVGISRIVKALRSEFEIYQEHRRELLDKYGELVEDGRFKFNSDEDAINFNKEFTELLNYEVELDIEPVKLISEIQINAETYMAIEKFIDIE